jgi:hypothetical protein
MKLLQIVQKYHRVSSGMGDRLWDRWLLLAFLHFKSYLLVLFFRVHLILLLEELITLFNFFYVSHLTYSSIIYITLIPFSLVPYGPNELLYILSFIYLNIKFICYHLLLVNNHFSHLIYHHNIKNLYKGILLKIRVFVEGPLFTFIHRNKIIIFFIIFIIINKIIFFIFIYIYNYIYFNEASFYIFMSRCYIHIDYPVRERVVDSAHWRFPNHS